MQEKFYQSRVIVNECLIDEKQIKYDVCSDKRLDKAIESMGEHFKLLGSGYIYFINGYRQKSLKLLHFFVKIN